MAADKSGARVAVALCDDGGCVCQGALYLQVELLGLVIYVGVWAVVVVRMCTCVYRCACLCMWVYGGQRLMECVFLLLCHFLPISAPLMAMKEHLYRHKFHFWGQTGYSEHAVSILPSLV